MKNVTVEVVDEKRLKKPAAEVGEMPQAPVVPGGLLNDAQELIQPAVTWYTCKMCGKSGEGVCFPITLVQE